MELKKRLGFFSVFSIATGAMISSGLFILPGLAFKQTGPAVILSYLLAGLLSLPGMLSLTEMTTAMPKAGGDCFTIMRSMGPAVGTVAGLLSWFSLAMKSAFALVGMSIFTVLLVQIDIHIIAVLFCLIFLAINIIGVKEAALLQNFMVIGLLTLMAFYILTGWTSMKMENLTPFLSKGTYSVFYSAGLVFVSYAGLLKIASVAEEIQNPSKNIPLAMLSALVIVVILYSLMVLVTVGVLDEEILEASRRPISDGAKAFLGRGGEIALSIAAILAFLSTANAGMMTAARSLVPLSVDNLFPTAFGKINKKTGTPVHALIITAIFITVSLFFQLKILVEAASLVLVLTNILTCLSVIILRESKIENYRPKFRAPFYPWLQIIGIALLILLILQMGLEALIISLILIFSGGLTYWLYGRFKGYREYALLHLIEKVISRKMTTHKLEEELKAILRERDSMVMDRFDHLVEEALVLDLSAEYDINSLFKEISGKIADHLKLDPAAVEKMLVERERESSTAINQFIAIPHVVTAAETEFLLVIVRDKKGIHFSETYPSIKAMFFLIGSREERNFHLQSLAALAQIVQEEDFEMRWLRAKNENVLRDILLLGKRKR